MSQHWIYQESYQRTIDQLFPGTVQLLWTDPPFGTGQKQQLKSTSGTNFAYNDRSAYEASAMVLDMMQRVYPKMYRTGVIALCLDYRIVHEVKTMVDETTDFVFEGEIIWHFELGATSRSWWTNKHNTILLWSLGQPKFHLDRVPKTRRKEKRGEYQSDERKVNSVWSITMSPTDPQRTGYPNQKPLDLILPFVDVHTDEGDLVFDPFAGSGSTGEAALMRGRRCVLGDISPDAVNVMQRRLAQ